MKWLNSASRSKTSSGVVHQHKYKRFTAYSNVKTRPKTCLDVHTDVRKFWMWETGHTSSNRLYCWQNPFIATLKITQRLEAPCSTTPCRYRPRLAALVQCHYSQFSTLIMTDPLEQVDGQMTHCPLAW